MIDFGKHLSRPSGEKVIDPIKIYERLDRASDKGPLRPAQMAVLTEWHRSRRDLRDVILKLHTGQGKTLVGLLMLQSRLNAGEGPALYLCPNKFLVTQTVEQARQFGIHCVTTEGDLPMAFQNAEAILVTSVQKLFNGLSKFGLKHQSLSVDSLVMDDAHACIDAIKSSYTIRLPEDHEGYRALLALFETSLQEQGAGTYEEIRAGKSTAFLPVPYWDWIDRSQEVIARMARYVHDEAVKFAWPLVKNLIPNCLCLVSGRGLEIVPYRPPLDLFGSYDKARHRVFMSATVTDDSFLIKGLGLTEAAITSPLVDHDEKWSGEKMILIPSLIDPSLTDMEVAPGFVRPAERHRVNTVILCPSFEATEMWRAAGAEVVKEHIDQQVAALRGGLHPQALVLANRYDGIDLPDDACRILILDSRPFAGDLMEQYMESCREGSEIVALRLARTVEQGMGRSVRGEKDYSVILVVGNDLVRYVHARQTRKYLSPQTRTQLEIGLEVARLASAQVCSGIEPARALHEVIRQCLGRDPGWKDYYFEQMGRMGVSTLPAGAVKIFSAEAEAESAYQIGNVDSAVAIMQTLIDNHVKTLAEKGWYLQEMARYTYQSQKTRSTELQAAAHTHNHYLLKPRTGVTIAKITLQGQKRLTNIIESLRGRQAFTDVEVEVNDLLRRLEFGVRADAFERALNELAVLLGFSGDRPDKEWGQGPDNLWAVRDGEYILFECKNQVEVTRASINKEETGQMNNALAWFHRTYDGAMVKPILIIPTKKLAPAAGFNGDVTILRAKGLRKLHHNVKGFFQEFRHQDFGDLSPERIQHYLVTHALTVEALYTEYGESPVLF